jgi:hypothetical protein
LPGLYAGRKNTGRCASHTPSPSCFSPKLPSPSNPPALLTDPKLTPGDVFDVTAQDICVPGYAKKVRAVPAWLKRKVYVEYGITEYKTGDYEVDHLIPLSLAAPH